MRGALFGLLASCIGLAPIGCAGARGEPDPSPPAEPAKSGTFIAFAADFQGFQGWDHYPARGDGGASDPAHADPTLVEYINRRAPPGSLTFPVGTMIVKEGSEGDPLEREFFAMVKRGGDYNASGAVGWEWFELRNLATPGTVTIVWRGFGPPMGEIYGGDALGGCNECHASAQRDSVFAEEASE